MKNKFLYILYDERAIFGDTDDATVFETSFADNFGKKQKGAVYRYKLVYNHNTNEQELTEETLVRVIS